MLDATPQQAVATQQHDSAASLATVTHGVLRQWCVAHTEPGAERYANDNLTRSGYQTYLPLIAVQRRDRVTRSLTHTVTIPLFTRYLFVANDNPALWRPIRETPGVASVISSNGRAHHARAGAVEALQAGEETRRLLTARRAVYVPGDAVAVRYGIVAGHRGVVTSVHGDTVSVALLFLGELRDIRLPLDCLAPVSADA
jgi:transcription antitermination factor NusG